MTGITGVHITKCEHDGHGNDNDNYSGTVSKSNFQKKLIFEHLQLTIDGDDGRRERRVTGATGDGHHECAHYECEHDGCGNDYNGHDGTVSKHNFQKKMIFNCLQLS